jgi:hypothetical protein
MRAPQAANSRPPGLLQRTVAVLEIFVASARWGGSGPTAARTSGLELGQMETKGASVLYVRDGKVTKLVLYADREGALADLGLAPEDDPAELPD